MIGFGPLQDEEPSPPRGGRPWGRLVPLAALLSVVVLLSGCGPAADQVYSTISPQTDKAEGIQGLYKITFGAALVVFIAVQVAIGYTALRFRRRGDARPEQVHGSRKLEIAWTVIPAAILLVLFIPTARVIYEQAAAEAATEGTFQVDVLGKQWWWEIAYPNIPADPSDAALGPLTTANEMIVPVGANVILNLHSNNVIHSFWVPQLSGKTDVVPGHQNRLQFVAAKPGDYYGECAEFCGGSHAWMRFKVKVVPQEAFDAWIAAWRTPPTSDGNPETADVVEAPAAFGACLACHRINGTNARIAPEGIAANPGTLDPETGEVDSESRGPGPNLTLLACRDTIGAGILKNTPENIETWLKHTDEVKEGVYMPNYYKQQDLTDEQVTELATYLSSLKPAGGCPDAGLPVGGEIDPSAVGAPE